MSRFLGAIDQGTTSSRFIVWDRSALNDGRPIVMGIIADITKSATCTRAPMG
jgi:hypothetical protein